MQQRVATFVVNACVLKFCEPNICIQPAESAGLVRGFMDDLIGRLVATIGVDRTAAEKAVGTLLQSAIVGAIPASASSSDV
jgi:hypothetical protein